MKTDKLNDCLDYILNWELLNAEDHGNFSTKGPLNGLAFIEPFRKELLENLIDLEHQQQINLINYYIVGIYKTANSDFIRDLHEVTFKNEIEGAEKIPIVNLHEENDPEAFEIIRFIWWLFIEIDDCCLTYKIPLARLLEDHDIDLHAFFNDPPITMLESDEVISMSDKEPMNESRPEQKPLVIKPVFKPDAISTIYELLKDYFSPGQQDQLLTLLKTGDNVREKLLFMDHSNRLTDSFKQLIEKGFILTCPKKVLREWICQNFQFLHRGLAKPFNPDTVDATLTENQNPCKNPLIAIQDGQIIQYPHPRH